MVTEIKTMHFQSVVQILRILLKKRTIDDSRLLLMRRSLNIVKSIFYFHYVAYIYLHHGENMTLYFRKLKSPASMMFCVKFGHETGTAILEKFTIFVV